MHIVHVLEAVRGGTSTYVTRLALDQLMRGHEVTLIADKNKITSELRGLPVAIKHYNSTRNPLTIVKTIAEVRGIIAYFRPTIVHAHGTFPGVYVRAIKPRCKVVYCPHGWAFEQELPWPVRAGYAAIERMLDHNSDATINISHAEMRAAVRWGFHPAKQIVIPSGVDASRPVGLHYIEPKKGVINLGFLGRFDRQKGLDVLLDAMLKCPDRAHLWIAGGWDRDRDKGRIYPLNATFVGWLNHDQVDDFLADLDALVIPSRWEGFGLIAAEAMRNGVPVIASDRGGLPEQVIHGFNGLLFNMDDPRGLSDTLRILTREELTGMRANARAVYQASLTAKPMLERINVLYHACLRGAA
jgi:glycosyltransferase involved in cell wall biosynthesis